MEIDKNRKKNLYFPDGTGTKLTCLVQSDHLSYWVLGYKLHVWRESDHTARVRRHILAFAGRARLFLVFLLICRFLELQYCSRMLSRSSSAHYMLILSLLYFCYI